ncbi:DUF6157 family protein [Novosphingobium sp. 9U]|uniref:DUF6157 family protein n=1 Tax=Novosphingobium sp. 9U TaxID=2653158 RepID=UPI0012F02105|nr:DUF6157 family protein [Novosphingobium sp. 9U]VWX47015.1 conserved hypothetical protein [Novosphingobium sp. 9U]
MTTNYQDTFITVSPDCGLAAANRTPKPGSVAAQQLERLLAAPYTLTSDDLLFAVHAARHEAPEAEHAALRAEFESKPRACLRASPLVKTHGWGLHHDCQGRVAAVAIEDPDYAVLLADPALKIRAGMRSKR